MGFEQRDNSGAAWKNRRRTRDNQPNYTGSAMIDGKEYYVSCWIKPDRSRNADDGDKFISFSVTPKEEQRDTGRGSSRDEIDDGDIPF